MDISNLFNESALQEIETVLQAHTANQGSITRTNLAAELGLIEPLSEGATEDQKRRNLTVESVVGALISLNVIPGYQNRKGPGDGIGVAGQRPKGEKGKNASPRQVNLPEGFVERLQAALDEGIPADDYKSRMTRSAIAKALGEPGSETETLISQALKSGRLTGFGTYRGVGGGVGRVLEAQAVSNPEPAEDESETSESNESNDSVLTEETESLDVSAAETSDEPAVESEGSEVSTDSEETEAQPETRPEPKKSRKNRKS